VQTVDGLGRDLHRGLETKGKVRAGEIVVDGLGHPDDVDAFLVQLGGDAEGVLAADGHHRPDVQGVQVPQHGLGAARLLEGIRAAGAQDGAPQVEDAAGRLAGEPVVERRVQKSAPAFPHAHHLQAVLLPATDHRADHRVEARAVSSARQDRDLHDGGTSQDRGPISSFRSASDGG